MKVLVATQKPFAKAAVDGIRAIVEKAGYELVLLEKYETPEELYAAVADVDAMIVRSDKVTAQVIDAAKNLKVVVRAGAGFDNLDLAACTANNIVAMNTPGQNSNAVAELALGMMIYMARNTFKPGTGAELKGKKVGIQAYGNVGRLVAEKARALGMEACSRHGCLGFRSLRPERENGSRRCGRSRHPRRDVQKLQLHLPPYPRQ